jgi:ankyrin repeat protein
MEAIMKKLLNLIAILLVSNLLVNTIVCSELEKKLSEIFFKALEQGKGPEAWNAIAEGRKRNIAVINLLDKEGYTALYRACMSGDLKTATLFLKEPDIDPNLHPSGKLHLLLGVMHTYNTRKTTEAYKNIAILLINHPRTDLNQTFLDNTTALMFAIISKNYDIAQRIFSTKKANLTTQHKHSGLTAFSLLCLTTDDYREKGLQSIIEAFFANNPETFINIPDSFESSLLHIILNKCAPINEIPFLFSKLLKHGINVNKQSIQGTTPLMLAIERKNKEAVKMLLECPDIDLRLVDVEGNNALMIASIYYHHEIHKLIEAAIREKSPDTFESTNNDGFNYQQLIPDYVKQGAALIKQEAIDKKKAAHQKKAQEKKSKIEEQNYLDQIDRELNEQAVRKYKETIEDICAVGNESSAARSDTRRYHIEYTKSCNRWMNIAQHAPDDEVMRLWLGQNGYFKKDPSKEKEPIRSRAECYHSLTKSMSEIEACKRIVFEHAFPKIIDRTIIDYHSLIKKPDTEDPNVKITVPATYTNGPMTHEGEYELFLKKTASGNYAVFHRVFKEKNVKVKPKDAATEKAIDKKATSDKKKGAATGGADAQALIDDQTTEDQFESVSQFLVLEPQLTRSRKNIIHTIIDQKTNNTYTITLPNHQ